MRREETDLDNNDPVLIIETYETRHGHREKTYLDFVICLQKNCDWQRKLMN